MKVMEWYVLNYDFNKKQIIKFNIFNNVKFDSGVKELLEDYTDIDDLVLGLTSLLRYCFWCRREYEISVGDAFETDLDRYVKLDVFEQVMPNVKALAHYIIDCQCE